MTDTTPNTPIVRRRASGIAMLALLMGLTGCAGDNNDAPTPGTAVRVAVSTSGPAAPPIEASGLVGSQDEMRLSFRTGGFIRRVAVKEGDRVRRGQLLAELELTEIDAQVEQARQMALKAERDLARGERLQAEQVISQEALENLRTQAQVARAARTAAEFNLGYSTIRAPRDGIVLRRLAEERESVPPGQPVIIFGSPERGTVVRLALADRDVVRLALEDPATVRIDAYPGRTFQAKISEISAAADQRNGLFPAQIRLDPVTDVTLASGLVAKVMIDPASSRRSTLTHVPIAALVDGRRDRAFVFIIEKEIARKREVGIAYLAGESVALSGGLPVGVPVITEGALYLQDGERVRVLP